MNYLLPERLDALARDYAVGTLRGHARRRFERVLREQPAAVRSVAEWQGRLATLAEAVPAVAPREQAWEAIESRLFGVPATATPAATAPARHRWAAWLGGALGVRGAGALALGALLAAGALRWQPQWAGLEPASAGLPAAYVGILSDPQGQALLLASSRRQGQLLTLKWVRPVAAPAGSVARLWALPAAGGAPRWVGDFNPQGSVQLDLPARSEALFAQVDRLAVSVEAGPAGATPVGAFLAIGPCVKLW